MDMGAENMENVVAWEGRVQKTDTAPKKACSPNFHVPADLRIEPSVIRADKAPKSTPHSVNLTSFIASG